MTNELPELPRWSDVVSGMDYAHIGHDRMKYVQQYAIAYARAAVQQAGVRSFPMDFLPADFPIEILEVAKEGGPDYWLGYIAGRNYTPTASAVEAVAWQRRSSADGYTSKWSEWVPSEHPDEQFPLTTGRWKHEYRPLYLAPPSAGVTEARLRDLVEAAQGFELVEHADETWLVFRSSVEKGLGAGSVRLDGPMAKDARARFALLRAALSAAKGQGG